MHFFYLEREKNVFKTVCVILLKSDLPQESFFFSFLTYQRILQHYAEMPRNHFQRCTLRYEFNTFYNQGKKNSIISLSRQRLYRRAAFHHTVKISLFSEALKRILI